MPVGDVKVETVPRKILLLRFSSLGDIVMTTAMIRCVRARFPRAQIDMAVREDFLGLIADNPHLDRKLSLSRGSGVRGLLALLKDINRERYDLVYDAHRSLRTLFLMPLIRAGGKRYYRKRYLKRNLALTFKLPFLKGEKRFLEKFVEPLYAEGVRYDGGGPEIFIDTSIDAVAKQKAQLPTTAHRRIGVIPNAQWQGKRWPLEKFRGLIEKLVKDTSHQVVVFGGPEDTFCEKLVDQMPRDRVFNLQGKLNLRETSAILKTCDLVVANDTGLMHMADALGVPSVLILGPTSGDLGCLPFHPRAQIVERDLWCRPCSKNGQAPCIRGRRICLEEIPVESVWSGVQKLAVGLQ
jgi:lipopolysaccharide heptosyltransferase II